MHPWSADRRQFLHTLAGGAAERQVRVEAEAHRDGRAACGDHGGRDAERRGAYLDRELEAGVAPEARHAGDGTVGHRGQRVLHEADRLGPTAGAERRRAVDEEDDGDPVGGYLPSGTVAGVITDRPSCAELIERILREAEETLARLAAAKES